MCPQNSLLTIASRLVVISSDLTYSALRHTSCPHSLISHLVSLSTVIWLAIYWTLQKLFLLWKNNSSLNILVHISWCTCAVISLGYNTDSKTMPLFILLRHYNSSYVYDWPCLHSPEPARYQFTSAWSIEILWVRSVKNIAKSDVKDIGGLSYINYTKRSYTIRNNIHRTYDSLCRNKEEGKIKNDS